MRQKSKSPFQIGWESAKANVVPMIVLSCLTLAIVVGYYNVPVIAQGLNPLAAWQNEWGWMAAFVNRSVFCVLLPGLFILPRTGLRPERPYAVLLGQMCWGGVCGVMTDWMFTLNAYLFGTGVDLLTLCIKTAVCQFAWTPLFFIPAGAVVYFWLGHGLSVDAARKDWPRHFLRDQILPNLLANWVIWIPATVLIHCLPTALQIQLSGTVGVFHALVMLKIGRGVTNGGTTGMSRLRCI